MIIGVSIGIFGVVVVGVGFLLVFFIVGIFIVFFVGGGVLVILGGGIIIGVKFVEFKFNYGIKDVLKWYYNCYEERYMSLMVIID